MTQLLINSVPSGAEVMIDGEIIGTTPLTTTIDEPQPIDMAVFISPQYKDDGEILSAIQTYADAVKADIGWNITTVKVDGAQNKYDAIDAVIKDMYWNNPLKACLMVGEDMAGDDDVFHNSSGMKCGQAIVPWCTLSEIHFSPACDRKVVLSIIRVDVPISLLYPNSGDSYRTKKTELVSAFIKFSENRDKVYTNNVLAFCDDSESIDVLDKLEDKLPIMGNTNITVNPTQSGVDDSMLENYKFFGAFGHGSPYTVAVTPSESYFNVPRAEIVKTPMLMVHGCSTECWQTSINNDCLYQKSSSNRFGHSIFDNPNLRIVVAGFPVMNYSDIYSPGFGFVINAMGKMALGLTVAESMKGMWSYGSNDTLFGDPTFHY